MRESRGQSTQQRAAPRSFSVREGKANEDEEEHCGDMETFEVVEVEIIEAVLN